MVYQDDSGKWIAVNEANVVLYRGDSREEAVEALRDERS